MNSARILAKIAELSEKIHGLQQQINNSKSTLESLVQKAMEHETALMDYQGILEEIGNSALEETSIEKTPEPKTASLNIPTPAEPVEQVPIPEPVQKTEPEQPPTAPIASTPPESVKEAPKPEPVIETEPVTEKDTSNEAPPAPKATEGAPVAPIQATNPEPGPAQLKSEPVETVSGTSINEQFKEQQGEVLADRLSKSGVNDLRTAIGVNERFLLINSLFGGDTTAYNQAIHTLNQQPDYTHAAQKMQQEYAIKHNWDVESREVALLTGLLEKRYQPA